MYKNLCILLFSFFSITASGQTVTWEDFTQDYLIQQTNSISQEKLQTLTEDLLELHRNPLNINNTNKEQLLSLPFLTENQVDSILSYIKKYGPLLSIAELSFVHSLDKLTQDYLSLFIYCGKSKKNRAEDFKHILAVNLDCPLYRRAGFNHYSSEELKKSPNKNYKGSPLGSTLRYRGSYGTQMDWGITLQNDEGEPFASHGNYPFDFKSFYFLRHSSGILKNWIVGDFRMHFGLGLTVGQGIWNNPLALISFSRNTKQGIIKHSSAEETQYFRGAATEIHFHKISITTFASYRDLDATIKKGFVTTLLTTGYHRTQSELDKKGILHAVTVGLSTNCNIQNFNIGISFIHTAFSKPFTTGSAIYRKYYMQGKNFNNLGLHYFLNIGTGYLDGEIAIAQKQGFASLNILKIPITPQFHFVALHRYYDKRYCAPYAFAYSSSGHIKNEHGLLLGFTWKISRQWNYKMFFDAIYHPYATYDATRSSKGMNSFQQIEYSSDKDLSLSLRYHFQNKEKDNADSSSLFSNFRHYWRFQAKYKIGIMKYVSTFDAICINTTNKKNSWGRMLSQRTSIKIKNINFSALAAWFHTADYNTAIYLYEPQLLYLFTFPCYFYHGLRTTFTVSANLTANLNFAIKYGLTYYTNKKTISSTQQLIKHPTKNDLYFQLCWKF